MNCLPDPRSKHGFRGFSGTDLLVTVALVLLLTSIVVLVATRMRTKTQLAQCQENLRQINAAVLAYAEDHGSRIPGFPQAPAPGGWWHYKEEVKTHLSSKNTESPDAVWACPKDRGYGEGTEKPLPFHRSKKHKNTSYVLNSVDLPGMPNVAGRETSAIKDPARTLLTMEWVAHAPLSWHHSRTGKKNTPFYNNALSVVGFVDGHVDYIPIYYDGLNAAYTRDPLPGYAYKYSAD